MSGWFFARRRQSRSSLDAHYSGNLASSNSLAVVHFALERYERVSGRWIKSALFSVPIEPVDSPPVTTHQQHHTPQKELPEGITKGTGGRNRRITRDCAVSEVVASWRSWLDQGGFEEWCMMNATSGSSSSSSSSSSMSTSPYRNRTFKKAKRPNHVFLLPAQPPATDWRLLFCCRDILPPRAMAGQGESETESDESGESDNDITENQARNKSIEFRKGIGCDSPRHPRN